MARYSNEFKEQAIKLSDEVGLKNAAAQLGIPYYTLADWRHYGICGRKKASEPVKDLTEAEKSIRILELERENRELKQANEILKDALGFFAKDRKK